MIKATATEQSTGRPVLVLGLDANNVRRLMSGDPISITFDDVRAMGLPELAILIYGGADEAELVRQIAPAIDAETVIRDQAGEQP